MLSRIITTLAATFLALPLWAAELGDDGLHKAAWLHNTFKDLSEDLAEANNEGKRLLIIIEQRGCIYCTRMHEKIFPIPEIAQILTDDYFVVQMNMFGDVDVTDFDGTVLSEKEMVRKWGALFTPTMMFFPEAVPEGVSAKDAAVAIMPGAFEKGTTRDLLNWVLEKGYDGGEGFQKYHARKITERQK